MKQSGFYATHRNSGEDELPQSRLETRAETSAFSIPTSQHSLLTDALDGVTFSQPRKLRGLTLDGPSPLHLRVGERVFIVRPGENRFHPPIRLEPGDCLRLEPMDNSPSGGTHA